MKKPALCGGLVALAAGLILAGAFWLAGVPAYADSFHCSTDNFGNTDCYDTTPATMPTYVPRYVPPVVVTVPTYVPPVVVTVPTYVPSPPTTGATDEAVSWLVNLVKHWWWFGLFLAAIAIANASPSSKVHRDATGGPAGEATTTPSALTGASNPVATRSKLDDARDGLTNLGDQRLSKTTAVAVIIGVVGIGMVLMFVALGSAP